MSRPIYTITYTGKDGGEGTIDTTDVKGSIAFLENWGYTIRETKLKKQV